VIFVHFWGKKKTTFLGQQSKNKSKGKKENVKEESKVAQGEM